jgi:hypothetical protein
MIKKEERAVLKTQLGTSYVKKVKQILHRSHVCNRNGLPYSSSMIRRVFNGYCEHKDIEDAILRAYVKSKQANEIYIATKRKILGLK